MGKYRTGLYLNLAKKRTTAGWVFFVLVAILGKGNFKDIIAGVPFILCGEIFRSLSAGIIKKNEILATDGTYGLCRHPLYFGSFLIATGFVIASKSFFIFLYFLLLFPLFYLSSIKAEENYLIQKFGQNYIEYRKKTPAFFPKFRKVNLKNVSFLQMIKNEEYINWLIILILLFWLLIKNKIFSSY